MQGAVSAMASIRANVVNDHPKSHDVQTALHDIGSLSDEVFDNEGERRKALLAAYALVARLETPWELVARICMGQVSSCKHFQHPTFSGLVWLLPSFVFFPSCFDKSKEADEGLM